RAAVAAALPSGARGDPRGGGERRSVRSRGRLHDLAGRRQCRRCPALRRLGPAPGPRAPGDARRHRGLRAPAAPGGGFRRGLVGGGEGSAGPLQSLRPWAPDRGIEVEAAPDLPRAVRQRAAQRWDIVLAVLGERADDDVTWWVEALRGAAGSPQLLTAAHRPSMGLVLRAEKLGVLDLLSLPARREDLQRALERVRAVATEVPLPLPEAEPHAV